MKANDILKIKGNILYTTFPEQNLILIIDHMAKLDIGSFVVMDKGSLVGLITFREILQLLAKKEKLNLDIPVGKIMQKEPVTASVDMDVTHLQKLMINQHIRYLPVVNEGILMGILSFHDVARAGLVAKDLENQHLINYLHR
ncbi:MAG: CBS domain-containing protein [SAR324 cluster bacterium]|nr:CBS domain-containing protein [SAR324 cluster bacterium]